jgi:lipopolysaccharide export system permease protein
MSGDREMIAARACGVSLYRLAVPVMAFGVVMYAVTSYFAFSLRPWANLNLRHKLYELTQTRSEAGLKEKVFNKNFPGLVVYVDEMSASDGSLKGVMISDARNPQQQNTIVAKRGVLLPDEQNATLTLRLYDGSIFGVEADSDASHVTSFRFYDLSVQPEEALDLHQSDPEELSFPELRRRILQSRNAGQPDWDAETELAGKFTIPFATMFCALLGVSLGLRPARGGQSERFGVSVALFFAYYSLLRVGESYAQRGKLNPFIAMSIPDLIFTALAVWLFLRAAADRGDQGRGPGDFIWDLIERFERSRQAA